MLEDLAETSKILLPEDVGGRAFHIGPMVGARVSKKIGNSFRIFLDGMGFYDMMDLTSSKKSVENKRSQHHASVMFGFAFTIGGEGPGYNPGSFF